MPNIEKVLKTAAVHSCGGQTYTAVAKLVMRDKPFGTFGGPHADELTARFSNKWILKIEGTPASWYLSTFDGSTAAQAHIDMGQGWVLENLAEILKEARELA